MEIRIALRGRVELTGWIVDQFGYACAGLRVTIRGPAEKVDTGEPAARSEHIGIAELALQSDSQGRFATDELTAGVTVSVAVTGATVDGVRVFALEREILFESRGPSELELEVELGATLACIGQFPGDAPAGVPVGFVVYKVDPAKTPSAADELLERRETIDAENAQFTIGPVKPATTGVKLRCLIREGAPGAILAAEVDLPSLPVGLHQVEVPFSAHQRPERQSVEVVVVDENYEDLGFGEIDPDVRVWVRGSERGRVRSLKPASRDAYVFRGEVRGGEVLYALGVQIGRMLAVKENVLLLEGEAHRFAFPTRILDQTATLDVRIDLPEGLSRAYVRLDSVGQQLPRRGRTTKESTTFWFLPPGAYRLECGMEFWSAPARIIELQPGERREVRIQPEPSRRVRGITPPSSRKALPASAAPPRLADRSRRSVPSSRVPRSSSPFP